MGGKHSYLEGKTFIVSVYISEIHDTENYTFITDTFSHLKFLFVDTSVLLAVLISDYQVAHP